MKQWIVLQIYKLMNISTSWLIHFKALQRKNWLILQAIPKYKRSARLQAQRSTGPAHQSALTTGLLPV